MFLFTIEIQKTRQFHKKNKIYFKKMPLNTKSPLQRDFSLFIFIFMYLFNRQDKEREVNNEVNG